MLSFWEDPFNREQFLILLRQGDSITEALKLMGEGANRSNLAAARKTDRNFDESIQLAMASAFTPTLRRLVEIAQFGDENDPATHKAWDIVMRHYNKALDREHRHAIVDHQADRMREMPTDRPGLQGPDNRLVIELLDAIKEVTDDDNTGEGTTGTTPALPAADE